ncbi:MAG: patatin-like phospholipase family protein [Chlorobiaceae bacterium]|nr:patatin-like phospholipase family protein [Chlorobiaceae bacterium]
MKKTGLAFGGGAVLGAAHVGVIRALSELHISVSMVSGTSIGAFIAALYAFGKNWQEIRDIAFDLDWLDLSGLVLSEYGLLSNKKFGGIVTELLGHKNIEDALIPLSIVATDIGTGKKVVFSEGDVALAVMASSCIPGIFRPVDYFGALLVDGVLMENVPVSPLIESGAESIICVDLLAHHAYKKPENIIGLLLNAFYSTITNTTAIQIASVDLCISPDLSQFNLIDFNQVPDILDAGYDAALPALTSWLEREG